MCSIRRPGLGGPQWATRWDLFSTRDKQSSSSTPESGHHLLLLKGRGLGEVKERTGENVRSKQNEERRWSRDRRRRKFTERKGGEERSPVTGGCAHLGVWMECYSPRGCWENLRAWLPVPTLAGGAGADVMWVSRSHHSKKGSQLAFCKKFYLINIYYVLKVT